MDADRKSAKEEGKDVKIPIWPNRRKKYSTAVIHIRDRLNEYIGKRYWKTYCAACFWGNISTPVNLCLTIATALTTGQAATQSLLNNEVFVDLCVSTLVVSTVNTFFRPHTMLSDALGELTEWNKIGLRFEELYYASPESLDELKDLQGKYRKLQSDIHEMQQSSPQKNAFTTDLIYRIGRSCCLKGGKERWVKEDNPKHLNDEMMALDRY
jgi:hypothetical protein